MVCRSGSARLVWAGRKPAGLLDEGGDRCHTLASPNVGEYEGTLAPHPAAVPVHHFEARADMGARSILLITSKSLRVMPGPPLRGILSPADTSMT